MQNLTITLVQTALVWEDIDANLSMFDARIDQISSLCDLIILPEMFSTGFSMEAARLAENMNGKAVNWLRAKSKTTGMHIAGSLMIEENGQFFNRLVWARPDGGLTYYDKKHLFAYAGEDKIYTPGNQLITINLKGWRIRPFICYDLRFPVWCRNLGPAYDLAVFVANWPAKRGAHWRALLRARAIENQAFVAAVNRVGTDGNGFEYRGDSALIDPQGNLLFERAWEESMPTLHLESRMLTDYRTAFPAWKDADEDLVRI
jgi:predicted amidohydrolase